MIDYKKILTLILFLLSTQVFAEKYNNNPCETPPRHFTVIGPSIIIESVEIKTPKPNFSVSKTSNTTFDVINDACDSHKIRWGAVGLKVIDANKPYDYNYIIFSDNDGTFHTEWEAVPEILSTRNVN